MLQPMKEINEQSHDEWSPCPIWIYRRKDSVRSIVQRGCDAYMFTDMEKKIAVRAVSADLGIASINSITVIDLSRGAAASERSVSRHRYTDMHLPESPVDDSSFSFSCASMTLSAFKRGNRRRLLITAPFLHLPSGEEGFKADITMTAEEEDQCSASLLHPEGSRGFSYRVDYLPLRAEGTLFIGDTISGLSEGSLASMSWYRSSGTFRSQQILRASSFGCTDGRKWGFSVSSGNAKENAIIIDGKAYQIGECIFSQHDGEWIIKSADGRFEAMMEASALEHTHGDMRLLKGECLDAFGLFSGYCRIPDGNTLGFSGAYGFARMLRGQALHG